MDLLAAVDLRTLLLWLGHSSGSNATEAHFRRIEQRDAAGLKISSADVSQLLRSRLSSARAQQERLGPSGRCRVGDGDCDGHGHGDGHYVVAAVLMAVVVVLEAIMSTSAFCGVWKGLSVA
jgi:hypothetical protein